MNFKTTLKVSFLLSFSLLCIRSSSYAWISPTLSSPADGSTQWAGVTLDWNAVASSAGYQLQVDTSLSFNSPVRLNVYQAYINSSSGNSDTQYWLDNIFFGKTYHWRVRAYVTGDSSAWASRTFYTSNSVTLYSPSSGTTQWTGLTLDWYPHAGIDYYDLEVDTSTAFSSSAKKTYAKTYINSSDGNSDTYQWVDDLFFGVKYYWRVRVRNTVDTSGWSTIWNFTTSNSVTLYSPSSGTTQWTGLTLDWYPHAGIDYYDLEVDTSTAFSSSAKKTYAKTYINSSDGNSDTYQWVDDLFFGVKYYWRVRVRNTVDTSGWSTIWNFTTSNSVTLYSPSSGTTQWAGVTLDWYPHAGIDYYDLEVDTSAAFSSSAKKTYAKTYINSSDGNSDTYQWVDDLFFGVKYYWRVRVRNTVDTSGWSTIWNFTTSNSVTLYSPSSGTTQWAGVTLDWYPHAGVDYYDLEVDTSAAFSSSAKKTYAKTYINSSDGNSDTYQWVDDLFFGVKYYWRVRVRNTVDTSGWSTIWNFTTADYVTLVSPSDGATSISVSGTTLDWNAHPGIDIYQMQFDTVNIFNSAFLITSNKTYINSSSGNSDTQYGTGALLTNHIYFWRVRAINAVDTTAWTYRSFTTGTQPVLIPSVPVLISPSIGAIGQDTALTLDWNTSTNATGYEYMYDINQNFSGPVSGNVTLNQIAINGLDINNMTYYWRVRAYNGTNIYSDWSSIWHFTTGCNVNAPSVNNTSVCDSGSVTLTATGAAGYNWYDAATGGNLICTSASYTSPVLYATDTFYVAGTDGSCESSRSMVIVYVYASPATPVISLNGYSLQSTPAYSYQWLLGGSVISGATSQTFTPVVNGNYSVVVSNANGCTAESSLFPYVWVGLDENSVNNGICIFPNPASEYLNIQNNSSAVISELYDIYGKLVLTQDLKEYDINVIRIHDLAKGCYFLMVRNDSKKVVMRFIKE